MTYDEAAVRLGVSHDAVRRRAARGRWARMPGNDGRARIQVPADVSAPRRGDVQGDTAALVSALDARERADRGITELTGERAARQADQEQLAAARAAADRATAELVELATAGGDRGDANLCRS
jgi:hypothetical protein